MKNSRGTGDSDAGHPAPAGSGGGRENVLDPAAGAEGTAANIREEQGTSAGGLVPASFAGEGGPGNPAAERHPEEAAAGPANPDTWDSEG